MEEFGIYYLSRQEIERQTAEVAELADAHGSGPCGSNTVRVQVSSSAFYGVKSGLRGSGFSPFFVYFPSKEWDNRV